MKHIVIFSHGFGTRKDDHGLFPDVIENLKNTNSIMFDYNEINESQNTIMVSPFSQQANILKENIEKVNKSNPDNIIDLICHSQGCLIVALLKPQNIRKIIFIAPPQKININHSIERYKNHTGSTINIEGISKLVRTDGSISIVPSQYWKELSEINPIDLYNKLSYITELNIIIPNQDEILKNANLSNLNTKIKIINIDGGHNFSGTSRKLLISTIKDILK